MKEEGSLKTQEEMLAYFRAMPSKRKENPYWDCEKDTGRILDKSTGLPVAFEEAAPLFRAVRNFFRLYYESFSSEAQVLFVTKDDAEHLAAMGVPVLASGTLGSCSVKAVVLPQDNRFGNTVISETFWQNRIINAGIYPVARMHSHHILSPYQSATDYASLNSRTLELVMGHIDQDTLHLCYWLDVPGTDQKRYTFLADERDEQFEHKAAADLQSGCGLLDKHIITQ